MSYNSSAIKARIRQKIKMHDYKYLIVFLNTYSSIFRRIDCRKNCWHPQVQANWSSTGPGGKQVECMLGAIAKFKNKGVTDDHVAFSFVSRRIQPLQVRKHPAFRYEGTKDPTRLSPEAMAHSEVVRRCCKVLDNFRQVIGVASTLLVSQLTREDMGKY